MFLFYAGNGVRRANHRLHQEKSASSLVTCRILRPVAGSRGKVTRLPGYGVGLHSNSQYGERFTSINNELFIGWSSDRELGIIK
jgi:hypothetical protein